MIALLPVHRTLLAFGVFATGLALNLVVTAPVGRGALLLSSLAAMLLHRVALRRLWPVAWVLCAAIVGFGLSQATRFSAPHLPQTAFRAVTGVAWCVWFSSVVTWTQMRDAARGLNLPSAVIDLMDSSMLHMQLLVQTLQQRCLAATARHGWSTPPQQLSNAGILLSGAFMSAWERSTRLEEAATLRSAKASSTTDATSPVFELLGARVADPPNVRLEVKRLCVETGAWVLLAGPSGAGKSTLLRVLCGLQPLAQGELQRFGCLVHGATAQKRVDRRVALVFQDPEDQFFASDVAADLAWGLKQRGVVGQEAEQKIQRALSTVGLEGFAQRQIASLSFGERKRLALASALVTDPDVLLCDEPTMGLDPVCTRMIVQAVENAAKWRPMTVVWATHDFGGLPSLIRHAVLLRDGKVSFAGTLETALSPACLAEAGLL